MEKVLDDSSFNSSQNKSNDEEFRKRVILGDLNNEFLEENDKCIIFRVTCNFDNYDTSKYNDDILSSFNSFTSKCD